MTMSCLFNHRKHKNAEGLEFFTTEHSKQHEIPTGKTTQKILFYFTQRAQRTRSFFFES